MKDQTGLRGHRIAFLILRLLFLEKIIQVAWQTHAGIFHNDPLGIDENFVWYVSDAIILRWPTRTMDGMALEILVLVKPFHSCQGIHIYQNKVHSTFVFWVSSNFINLLGRGPTCRSHILVEIHYSWILGLVNDLGQRRLSVPQLDLDIWRLGANNFGRKLFILALGYLIDAEIYNDS